MATSMLLVLGVWTIVLGLTPLLRVPLGADGALLFTFALATGVVVAARRDRRRRPIGRGWLFGGLGFATGFVSLPAWVALIAVAGLGIGLEPARPVAPGAGEATYWLASIAVAPLLEELLYRERLLAALRPRFGAAGAIAVSSALFALPHLRAWDVLGTALVGVGLGTVFCVSRSIALCVGLHAGLNAAAVACGLPPVRWAFLPTTSAPIGCGSILVVVALARPAHRTSEARA